MGANGRGPLYDVLHREHEEVSQNLKKILEDGNATRRANLWNDVYVSLLAHAKAEEREVYPALRQADGAQMEELAADAVEEHNEAETLMNRIDGIDPREQRFGELVKELHDLIEHHVEDEENELLPTADLAESRSEELARAYGERRDQLIEELMAQRSDRQIRDPLMARDKEELYAMAQEQGIPGRSDMSKDELVQALSSARS